MTDSTLQMQPELAALFGDPTFKDRAADVYARVRNQEAVTPLETGEGRVVWLVSRYDEALTVLRDANRFANDILSVMTQEQIDEFWSGRTQELTDDEREKMETIDRYISRQLLNVDPPDHTRLRKLVSQSFTPKYVEGLRGRVQELSDDLIRNIESRAATTGIREFELVNDYAYPLPLTVIAEMLGIPDADRAKFQEWSHAAVSFNPTGAEANDQFDLLYEFVQYMLKLADLKRADPADDLISGLVAAEEAGDRLSEEELIAMIFLLIVAGHETTVNLIANGTLDLLDHPEQRAQLLNDPALIKPAVEEMLRYSGPVEHSLARWAKEDVELGGVMIPRGSQLLVLLISADHDSTRFPDGDRFDVTRNPTRHLGFGMGIHACLGSPLARLEAEIAFRGLLTHFPEMTLAVPRQELVWRAGSLIRGLVALPVQY